MFVAFYLAPVTLCLSYDCYGYILTNAIKLVFKNSVDLTRLPKSGLLILPERVYVYSVLKAAIRLSPVYLNRDPNPPLDCLSVLQPNYPAVR